MNRTEQAIADAVREVFDGQSDDRKPACAFCGAPSGYPPAGPCPEHPVIPVSESTTERSET